MPTTDHPTTGPNAMRECNSCSHHDEVRHFRRRGDTYSCPECGSRPGVMVG